MYCFIEWVNRFYNNLLENSNTFIYQKCVDNIKMCKSNFRPGKDAFFQGCILEKSIHQNVWTKKQNKRNEKIHINKTSNLLIRRGNKMHCFMEGKELVICSFSNHLLNNFHTPAFSDYFIFISYAPWNDLIVVKWVIKIDNETCIYSFTTTLSKK